MTTNERIAALLGWARTDHEGGLWVEPGTGDFKYELPAFDSDPTTTGSLIEELRSRKWQLRINVNTLYVVEAFSPTSSGWGKASTLGDAVCTAVLDTLANGIC